LKQHMELLQDIITSTLKEKRHPPKLDGIKELVDFATKLEQASVQTIENGVMTKDLASLSEVPEKKIVNTEDFLKEIRKTFEGMA